MKIVQVNPFGQQVQTQGGVKFEENASLPREQVLGQQNLQPETQQTNLTNKVSEVSESDKTGEKNSSSKVDFYI